LKVLFDTNVLVAAFITHGVCQELLLEANKAYSLFLCPVVLEEFERIMRTKLSVPYEIVEEAKKLILEVSSTVEVSAKVEGACSDPDDDAILACAVSAGVDYLVTGDKDLLVMQNFRGVRIVTPREFASILWAGGGA